MRKVHTAALVLTLVCASCSGSGSFPTPALSPAEVVRLQVEALAGDEDDAGIAATFRFASPANRRMTGPLERFIGIVRAPAYLPLVNHHRAEYGEVLERDGEAVQVVTVIARDGSVRAYLFHLSRQHGGLWDGCWMTDSVHPLERAEEPGLPI